MNQQKQKSAFDLQYDDNHVAWLALDVVDSETNVLTENVIQEFDSFLDKVVDDKAKALIIYSKKAKGFIAGADVKAFAKITDESAARSHILRVHKVFDHLESLPFPTVAMIHGYCLGGGLELALACDYRVAQDDITLRIGFPEVKLGIFPGYGGSVRSIKLVGDLNALNMMLTGRLLSGRAAKKIGLVNYLVPQRQLKNAAIELINKQPKKRQIKWHQKWLGSWLLKKPLAAFLSYQVSKKVDENHYPAPFELIQHWQQFSSSPKAMYANEAKQVAKLICSETAQQLIRIYLLQSRLKSLGDKKAFKISKVHVIGGGVMGGDIAAWCALKGFQVTLQDRAPKYLGQAMMRAHKLFNRKLKDPYAIRDAIDRLMPDHLGLGVAEADVVIEAIYENAQAKRDLYTELETKMKKGALLGTNTSSLPLEELSLELNDKNRLVGLHFFNPVAQMPLLEVVTDENTNSDAISKALAFSRHIDKLPLPVKSAPGFLVNRVLMPYLLEAVMLLEEGVAAEKIDKAACDFGMPMGPIELADTVGLDICLSVAENLSEHFNNKVPELLKQKVEAKTLGKKTSEGFYHWKKGKPEKNPTPSRNFTDITEQITKRLIMRLVNESTACLEDGIVEDADLIDAGIIFGTGFAPFRGGPMQYRHLSHISHKS